MKIIRPEQPTKKQLLDEMVKFDQENNLIDEKPVIISRHDEELIDDNTGKDQKLFIYTKDESNIDIAKQTEDAYKNFCKDQTIKNLMDEIIKQKDDKIQVTISLTKRQYDLYLKKGGESWIKKAITGQQNKRRKK